MNARLGATFFALVLALAPLSASGAASLTDPQIAHIAYTAGAIDIAAAQLALKTSTNADVVAFANNMVSDHQAVNDQALALLKQLNVTPEDNAVSQSIVKQSADAQAKLASLSGAAFDKAYAANELAYHQLVNDALAKTLIPATSNAELKALLETGLKIFEGHQEHAAMLVKMLN